ncbi:hypothetical protein QWY84_17165 [Aquisalimonas lutea]|uniref:hypothetical protein n=1 Tax=Aquisalimonas lutea TaxID=1327750 RepID=UPI0025B51650|nr:hypothetical protein [Aquisalimonas lutea]MDN3519338.1 hypothetical protein [Aquisalimonas lutea]
MWSPSRYASILLAAMLGVAGAFTAVSAEVPQAYPAVYELTRITDDQSRVLASGEVLLMEGRPAEERTEGGDRAASVTLRFQVEHAGGGRQRLSVDSRVDIRLRRGERRLAAEGDSDSFIAGPEVQRVTFENRSWQNLTDPTPIRFRHTEEDARYEVTLMFEEQAFR